MKISTILEIIFPIMQIFAWGFFVSGSFGHGPVLVRSEGAGVEAGMSLASLQQSASRVQRSDPEQRLERQKLREARREERERSRRQRLERRQHRHQQASTDRPAVDNKRHSRADDIQWMKANLSSLWATVRELQNNQAHLLRSSAGHEPIVTNSLSATGMPGVASPCSPELSAEDCPDDDELQCRLGGDELTCSGRGECCCGQCLCQLPYFGTFCECNSDLCPMHDGVVCSGSGSCSCSSCECDAGFTGPACECPSHDGRCRDQDGGLCNNHGTCHCGRCECFSSYLGELCEQSLYSAGLCEELKPCVLCSALGRPLPQCRTCDLITVELTTELQPSQKLCRMVHSGCLLRYSYEAAEEGQFLVAVPASVIEDFRNCDEQNRNRVSVSRRN